MSLLGANHRRPLFHMVKLLFGLMKQKNLLTSSQLDILLIHVYMLTNTSEKK